MKSNLICALLCQVVGLGSALTVVAEPKMPPIGLIDVYGIRSVPEEKIRASLQLKENDAVPIERRAIEKRLAALSGVASAQLHVVCCDAGKSILYVGIEEKGNRGLAFRKAPTGKALLPDDVLQADEAFERAMMEAVQRGDAEEDQSQGHSLVKNPAARAVQERFIQFAVRDRKLLAKVLRTSSNATHRALAAEVIAYDTNKQAVVSDLVYATRDPAPGVRNNAVRALALIAAYGQKHRERQLTVPWTPFVDLLNSPVWTDRNKASFALMQLTETRDRELLKQLKARALPALLEMAQWKSRGHSLPSFVILGCIAGMPEDAILKAWEDNRHHLVIDAAKSASRPSTKF